MHDSLHLRNLSRLPSHLRKSAQSAVDGSTEALSQFLTRLSVYRVEYVLALPILFLYLDTSRLPTVAQLDSIISTPDRAPTSGPNLDLIRAAILSLHGISRMMVHSLLSRDVCIELRPRLHPWMLFANVFWQYVPPHLQVVGPKHTCAASSAILLDLGFNPDSASLVRNATGTRGILVKYRSALVDNDGIIAHEGSVAETDEWRDMASIIAFLSQDRDKSLRSLEHLAEGVDGSQHKLAQLLVKQMHLAAAHCDVRPEMGAMTLTAVLGLVDWSGDSAHFNETLLSYGLAPALVRAIRALDAHTRRSDAGSTGPVAGASVGVAFGMLISKFHRTSGNRWLMQALDAGLLHLIVSLGLSARQILPVDPKILELLQKVLQDVLPGYLLYYPVALRIKKYLPPAHAITTSRAFRKCDLFDLCGEFAKLLEANSTALDFLESKARRSAKACENMECLLITDKSNFQRCSGCGVAYYCSKECQKRDWEAGHKKGCPTLSSIDPPWAPSSRDRTFIRAVMQQTLSSLALKPILIRQAEFIYSNPGVDFFTIFNFTRRNDGASWISVLPLSQCAAAEAPFRSAHMARSGRRMQLHCVTLNGGPQPFSWMLPMWSNSSRLLDGLYRIVQSLPAGRQFSEVYAEAFLQLKELETECKAAAVVEVY
ncbi:hypothetical protein DFH06DRAFT_1364665 [Mycena polygramma]|nr:hypothetical protein DFH06DRAFT_1364665 [Mycena polygramma]